jgi:hypothetical protein
MCLLDLSGTSFACMYVSNFDDYGCCRGMLTDAWCNYVPYVLFMSYCTTCSSRILIIVSHQINFSPEWL